MNSKGIRFILLYTVVLAAVILAPVLIWQRNVIADVLVTPLPTVKLANEKVVDDATAYQNQYDFTTNWFTWNIPVWEKAFEQISGQANVNYLEVGAFEGRSAVWMLENVLTDPTARMTVVDVFDGPLKERYLANIDRSGAADKVNTITGYSQLVLRDLPLNSYDVIYIDGSHQEDDVLEDAVLSWRLLKEGGILIFDDYRWFGSSSQEITGVPKKAIDPFVECFQDHIDVVHNSYQVVLKKRARQISAE